MLSKQALRLSFKLRLKQQSLIISVLASLTILLSFQTHAQDSDSEKILNFCVDPDWMPFEGMVDGQHTGIASDYLKVFKELTDYSFTLVPTKSWNETLESLRKGECDVNLLLNSSVERENFLSFTIPYFIGPNVLVSKKDIPFMQDLGAVGELTLGVVEGYRLVEYISRFYPDIKIQTVASEEDGLIAADKGLVDVYVGSLYSINLTINKLNLRYLKINGWISLQDQLRIGFTKPNAHLVPIFNQAIEQISTSQHNEILNRWSNVQIVKQTDYTLLYYLGGAVTFIFMVFLWRYLVSKKVMAALHDKNKELEKTREELLVANKNLEYISFHDSLTSLYNRHYFMSTLKDHLNNILRHNSNSVLLMIDIDFFKKVNDKYGHLVGDKILQQFSVILSKVLRAGDVAARWGGEEFIVLLPKTSAEQSMCIATRLVETVEAYRFESNIGLTISVGAAQYKHGDELEAWIEMADTALYQAKDEGRNRIKAIV
ncbi:diguanylate cyclase [Glaciecola sp. MF2-115]|uniref:diguanylate cyclase n=1 Tax=Glaciecola sp. MF2-115 TaxID=3384827 RepID=UPI00399FFD94